MSEALPRPLPDPRPLPSLTVGAIQSRLDATFTPNSQRHNEAMAALEGLAAALERLASHGQRLWLTDAPPFEAREYPQALYHETHGMKAVANKKEEDEAYKEGWRRHPGLAGARAAPSGPSGPFAAYWAARRAAASSN